jgi:predicted RNase H-like HicB family nuclease
LKNIPIGVKKFQRGKRGKRQIEFRAISRNSPLFYQHGLVIFPRQRHISVMEIVFTVTQEADGGFVAECLSHDIFTQGDSWEALRANAQEAASAFFFDGPKPDSIRLHLVRDEVFARA